MAPLLHTHTHRLYTILCHLIHHTDAYSLGCWYRIKALGLNLVLALLHYLHVTVMTKHSLAWLLRIIDCVRLELNSCTGSSRGGRIPSVRDTRQGGQEWNKCLQNKSQVYSQCTFTVWPLRSLLPVDLTYFRSAAWGFLFVSSCEIPQKVTIK